jgi:hypothetical protein
VFQFNQTKIYTKNYSKCSYMFRFNQIIIREFTVCAPLNLRYWRQFNNKVF